MNIFFSINNLFEKSYVLAKKSLENKNNQAFVSCFKRFLETLKLQNVLLEVQISLSTAIHTAFQTNFNKSNFVCLALLHSERYIFFQYVYFRQKPI